MRYLLAILSDKYRSHVQILDESTPFSKLLSWPNILIRQAARGYDDLSCTCQQ